MNDACTGFAFFTSCIGIDELKFSKHKKSAGKNKQLEFKKVVKKVSKAKIASDASDEVKKEDGVSEKGSEADKADVPTLKVESTIEDDPSITKTDDDFYTFTVSTAPSITGNGGGGQTSSGPATLSN